MTKSTVGLRFAALTRVSTEEQAVRGESLTVQKKEIEWHVDQLQGSIVKWYTGHEHSTPGYERSILDQMLTDCPTGIFDALIICDFDRLGRDLSKIIDVIGTLRENRISLFIKGEMQDLHDPDKEMILYIMGSISQTVAVKGVRKSILSKINRAKRGWQVVGSKPFGRYLANPNADRSKEDAIWKIIPEDKKLAERLWYMFVKQGYGYKKIQSIHKNKC